MGLMVIVENEKDIVMPKQRSSSVSHHSIPMSC